MIVSIKILDMYSSHVKNEVHIIGPGASRLIGRINISNTEDMETSILSEEEERAFWASNLGKLTSEKKAAAVRKNGMKGGRPPKARQ